MAASSTRLPRLCGKIAIVTGSSSGIGRSIAIAFAQEGCDLVVCADLHSGPPLAKGPVESTLPNTNAESSVNAHVPTHEAICTQFGAGKSIFKACDVSQETAATQPGEDEVVGVKDLIEQVVKATGRLDILVNCAGLGIFAIPTHETTLETWNKCMAVNSTGPFLCIKHSLSQFLKQDPDECNFRGTIINITSIGSAVGLRECGAYCASKGSLTSLSRTVAIDYAAKGIRCNELCLGYIQTPMLQGPLDSETGFREYLNTWTPLQRLGQPSEVASAAVWLANNRESAYVTGTTLTVDGGFTAR